MPKPWPSPKSTLRILILCCLIGAGVSMIGAVHHVANPMPYPEVTWYREFSLLFFYSAVAFSLFYVEYRVVEMVLKRELLTPLGHVLTIGCLLLLLYGLALLWQAARTQELVAGAEERTFVWICVFGELMFLANAVWSIVQEPATTARPLMPQPQPPVAAVGLPTRVPTPARVATSGFAGNWGWPESPVDLFGIGAGFFVTVAVIFGIMEFPAARLPLPFLDSSRDFPAAAVWLLTAVPFLLFAVLYWFLWRSTHRAFDSSTTRVHFVCTLIAVLDAVRLLFRWATARGNSFAEPPSSADIGSVFALLTLAAFAFAWNALKNLNNASSRSAEGNR
jgi:hypothetical protein